MKTHEVCDLLSIVSPDPGLSSRVADVVSLLSCRQGVIYANARNSVIATESHSDSTLANECLWQKIARRSRSGCGLVQVGSKAAAGIRIRLHL